MTSPADEIRYGFDTLRDGLAPFVVKELHGRFQGKWIEKIKERKSVRLLADGSVHWDTQLLLQTVLLFWDDIFSAKMAERTFTLCHDLRAGRNALAHEEELSFADAEDILFGIERLLFFAGAMEKSTNVRSRRRTLGWMVDDERENAKLSDTQTSALPIHLQIVRLKIPQQDVIKSTGLHRRVVAIDDIVSLYNLQGDKGLGPNSIRSSIDDRLPLYPDYVFEKWNCIAEPDNNGPLLFISEWKPALLDDGNVLEIKFGRTDWHLQQAARASADKIWLDIFRGRLEFIERFPAYLTCAAVVTTKDNKLILLRRNRRVVDEPAEWSIGIGETMRPDQDICGELGLHPLNTILRGLDEELGIERHTAKQAEVTFLNLGFSVKNFALNLFSHVALPITALEVQIAQSRAEDNEHRGMAVLDFSLSSALRLIVKGSYLSRDEISEAPITSWSRLALLYECLRRFGTQRVQKGLASY